MTEKIVIIYQNLFYHTLEGWTCPESL